MVPEEVPGLPALFAHPPTRMQCNPPLPKPPTSTSTPNFRRLLASSIFLLACARARSLLEPADQRSVPNQCLRRKMILEKRHCARLVAFRRLQEVTHRRRAGAGYAQVSRLNRFERQRVSDVGIRTCPTRDDKPRHKAPR